MGALLAIALCRDARAAELPPDFAPKFAAPGNEAPVQPRKDGKMIPSHQIRRVAIEALTTERTARRAYREPGSVRECTRLRLARAAEALQLPAPPAPCAVADDQLLAVDDVSGDTARPSRFARRALRGRA
jgi:hypothetical protein